MEIWVAEQRDRREKDVPEGTTNACLLEFDYFSENIVASNARNIRQFDDPILPKPLARLHII